MRINLGKVYNEVITIINKIDAKDSEEKMDSFVKHQLEGCMWSIRTQREVQTDGTVTVGTSHIVQIPEDAEYLPYKEWVKLEDKNNNFTISAGDYVIKGIVEEDITASNIRSVVKKYEPDAFQVQMFRDATKGEGFEHSTAGIMRFVEPYIIEG